MFIKKVKYNFFFLSPYEDKKRIYLSKALKGTMVRIIFLFYVKS